MPMYDATSIPLDYVDCFWKEPFYYGGKTGDGQGWGGSINANICDATATYWAARIKLPDNAKLVFKGEYGQNRYASFSSYGITDPTASLDDFDIDPDEGSTNPYRNGALRTLPAAQRQFTITVLNADEPEDKSLKARNTLYARPPVTDMTTFGAPDQTMVDLRWRSYTPDREFDMRFDARGGGKLPFPEYMEFPAGSPECTFEGPNPCRRAFQCDMDPTGQTMQQPRGFTNSAIPVQEMRDLWDNQDYSCTNEEVKEKYDGWCNDPWVSPATDPPRFEKFFGIRYSYDGLFDPPPVREAMKQELIAGGLNCESGEETVGAPGIPANFNTNYGVMFIAQKFGKVFHVTAKKPRTPTTYWGDPVFDSEDAQVRYWSWTVGNERTTGQISGGVNDEMFPAVNDGYYSMVISLPEDRPKTATQACGHAWLDWNRRGDGTGRWGITTLVLRHMMVMNGWDQAMQSVCEPGKEKELMGEYYPESAYFQTPEDFDANIGCLQLDE